MKLGDKQVGKPEILYKDTKSNIESLSGLEEGAVAYATDTNEHGTYDGSSWTWGGGGGGGNHSYVGVSSTAYLKKITLSSAGTLLSISTYLKSAAAVFGQIRFVVLEDDSGSPGGLLGANASAGGSDSLYLPDGDHWYSQPIGIYLPSGDYWIGVWFSGDADDVSIDVDTSGGSDLTYGDSWIRDLTGRSTSTSAKSYSIRASILS